MIRHAAFALAILAAGPASALSCLAPSVSGTYNIADESPADYSIAVGSLYATGPSNPPQGAVALNGDINQMVGFTQPTQFVGAFFDGTNFALDRVTPVTVEVNCTVAWCGSYSDVNFGLFFFRRDADGSYALEANACPGNVFENPQPHHLEEVVSCYQNGC